MTTSVATQVAPLVATIDKTVMMNDTLMTIKAIPNVESKAFVLSKPSLKRPLDYVFVEKECSLQTRGQSRRSGSS